MEIKFFIFKKIIEILSNIFFKEIHVFGAENVPKTGPVILSCNHNNQYVDAMMLQSSLDRQINYIMAMKSTKIKILKFFLTFTKIIATKRPIDSAFTGEGTILHLKEGTKLKGKNTNFLKLKKGDSIKVTNGKLADVYRIEKIIDNENLELFKKYDNKEINLNYTVLPKLDQAAVYKSVIDKIVNGEVIGIYPEGGSHDQTQLIKLKPGACIFAYEAKRRLNKDVKIIPVSINYFGAHKFRSKVIINFGKPIKTEYDQTRFADSTYKREKISEMLINLRNKMEGCKITAPSLKELKNIYCAKEIYLPDTMELHEKKNFEILKKFCMAYQSLKDDKNVQELLSEINFFRIDLKKHSLKVRDLRNFKKVFSKSFWYYVKKIILLIFFTLPFLFVYLPIRFIVVRVAEEKRKKALARSFVKIKATDTLASATIMLSLMLFPIFFFVLNIFFFIFTYWYLNFSFIFALRTQMDFAFYFPIYLYFAITIYDELMKNTRIIFIRMKLYFFYNTYYTDKIQNFIKTRYLLKKKLAVLLESHKNGILEVIIGGDLLIEPKKINFEEKIDEMVNSISKNFVSVF